MAGWCQRRPNREPGPSLWPIGNKITVSSGVSGSHMKSSKEALLPLPTKNQWRPSGEHNTHLCTAVIKEHPHFGCQDRPRGEPGYLLPSGSNKAMLLLPLLEWVSQEAQIEV